MTTVRNAADLDALLADLPAPDQAASAAARAHQAQLTKPLGALGRLEDMACWMAGWQGQAKPELDAIQVIVFAGNHGVNAQGVSAFPANVTAQMVRNFETGGAAINQLCALYGADLMVVPLNLDWPTADFTTAAAMEADDCAAAINTGLTSIVKESQLLVVGEMGIGNTTIAAALGAACFGGKGHDWAGAGTGLDDAAISHKAKIIDQALNLHVRHIACPFEMLRRLGGREVAAMAGAILGARLNRIPVLLDGYVSCAAAGVLRHGQADALSHCLAGHVSAEQAHSSMLDKLGLTPVLDLGMRLGEGSGAAVAVGVLKAALATHNGMATFADAGVSAKNTPQ